MKKIGLLCICVLLLSGCGVSKLENGQDAVVSFKNGDKISVDDLYTKMKDSFALNTLITMVDIHVLEAQFPDYVETAESYAESHVKSAIESQGSEDAFLQAIQSMGYATTEAYQEYVYLSYLQNHAIEEYAKIQITDKDVEKYYEDKAKGDIEVSHILITPQVTEDMTDEEEEKAEKEAKDKAKDIIKELEKAEDLEAKFKELVKEHSEDTSTKEKDGSLGKITYGDLSSAYDELLDEAYKIKDGEISTKVVTTELGYHVIMRTKSHEKESLKDLTDEIRELLSENLLETDADIGIDALEHFRKENGVKIEDSELNDQYNKYIQNILAQINQQ